MTFEDFCVEPQGHIEAVVEFDGVLYAVKLDVTTESHVEDGEGFLKLKQTVHEVTKVTMTACSVLDDAGNATPYDGLADDQVKEVEWAAQTDHAETIIYDLKLFGHLRSLV